MRPRERQETSEQDLFRSRLDQIIDMKHALVKLARVHANPFAGIPPYRIGTHHTWTEQELTAYEAKWPGGAQASTLPPNGARSRNSAGRLGALGDRRWPGVWVSCIR